MRAVFSLVPSESKRLIGKAVAALPEVRRALAHGRIIIALGTSNAYVLEELLGRSIPKERFTAGVVTDKVQCITPASARLGQVFLEQGREVEGVSFEKFMEGMRGDDVVIKGGNAIDPEGNVGVLMSSRNGGTMARFLVAAVARGSGIIMPVGLEKLIPSVPKAVRACGIDRFELSIGQKVGLMPVVGATVVSEVEALRILTGVEAVHVASGGTGGSEGAVTLSIEGEADQVRHAVALVRRTKREKPIPRLKRFCKDCDEPCQLILRVETGG